MTHRDRLFSRNRLRKRWIIALAVALLLCAAIYFALARTIDHYLNEGGLARSLGKKTAVIMKADAGYLPLFWRGLSVRCGGLLVRGKPPRSLKEMRVSNLRAYCSLQDLWQRKFTINRLHADRLEIAFGTAAARQLTNILPSEPELQPPEDVPSPLKLVIRESVIARTNIFWGETPDAVGALRDVESKYYPDGPDLNAAGYGGTLQQTGWPSLRVDRIQIHYAKPKLTIQSAAFAIGKKDDVAMDGELDLGDNGSMHLHTRSTHAPAAPFLKGFWRGKFEGEFDGETQIDKKFAPGSKVNAEGELKFVHAEVHDVATLNRIAAITRRPQFEHLKLDELRGRYKWTGARLEVSEFQLEEKNLFRVEGNFAIEKKSIEGKFHLGVAGDVLQSIPGAREKVFTESRAGYFWTSLNLSGPLNHPREDLKERLVAAAEEELAKGFLAPLFKPGKGLIELLKAIYQ